MYSSERFMSYGVNYLNAQINEKAIEELQEIARSERRIMSRKKTRFERNLREHKMLEKDAFVKVKYVEHEIDNMKQNINSLKHGIEIYKHEPIEKPETQERIIEYSIELQRMEEKLEMLFKEREYLLDKFKYKRDLLKGIDFENE